MRASGSGGWLEEVSAFEGFVRGWVGEGSCWVGGWVGGCRIWLLELELRLRNDRVRNKMTMATKTGRYSSLLQI